MRCFTDGTTSPGATTQLLVLGPVEARVGAAAVPLGGGKQRTVFALLVLRAGDVVPLERLVDELWGDDPPSSAAHTLEVYVSRLRRALEPVGVRIERRGAGYRLDPGDASVDVAEFVRLAAEATSAAGRDDERASALGHAALALWRGPAVADVQLAAERERLEERRLGALETRFDADLALGRHAGLVAELRPLVHEHRLRERLVGQLMVALARSGRQADALAEYEATRRALRDELGLQPSGELQRLAGAIVRQEPVGPSSTATPSSSDAPAGRARRRVALGAAAVAAVLAVGAAVGLTGLGADGRGPADAPQVALLLSRPASVGKGDPGPSEVVDALRRAEHAFGVETEVLVVPEFAPRSAAARAAARRIRAGDFDLVVAPGATIWSVRDAVREPGRTRFATIDFAWPGGPPAAATAFVFDDRDAGYLVGYLSGLVEHRRGPRLNRRRVVSEIGGRPFPPVEGLLEGFTEGVRRALPGVTVLRAYSGDWVDQSKCGALADAQIDRGSDIVFPAAGTCGFGALSAAGVRGVWGIGFDGDRSYLGGHILASANKRFDIAVTTAVQSFLEGTLPPGGVVSLGIDDDAVGIVGISPDVPDDVLRKVEAAAAVLRRGRLP